ATVSASAPGSGTPSGTVNFTDGGSTITGCGAKTLSSGQATCSTSYAATGSHTIAAVYSGDSNYTTSTSANLTQTVQTNATVTSFTITPASPADAKPDTGDVAKVVFSADIDEHSVCSSWSTGGPTPTINVTATFTDAGGNNNDTMTLSTISAVCASFNFGTIDLGDKAYVSGAAVTETGSLGYDGTTHTLTLTLTSTNGSLGTKTG